MTLKDSTTQFIPLQQTKANFVQITTTDSPEKAGNYTIEKENEILGTISYNYNRSESHLNYLNPKDWEGATVHESVAELFKSINEANSVNSYWKWFVIFALVFLLFEMLILKFLK